jgi:hypothetical protein
MRKNTIITQMAVLTHWQTVVLDIHLNLSGQYCSVQMQSHACWLYF